MPLEIRTASEDDVSQVVAIERKAFADYYVHPSIYPTRPFHHDDYARKLSLIEQLRADPACRWTKVVDTSLPADQCMVSFAMWYSWRAPHTGPSTPLHAPEPLANAAAWQAFFGAVDRRRDEIVAGRAYFYVKTLFTDPAHQNRGAASMLLRSIVDEAKFLSQPVFLESNDSAESFFDEFGFDKKETFTVDLFDFGGTDTEAILMIREPL